MPRHPSHLRRHGNLAAALALLVVVAMLVAGRTAAGASPAEGGAAPERAATTWVVDAVDDARGNRWEAASTGTSTVRIAPGDTVEWQFDRAVIDHDLTSATDSPSPWTPAVAEYRQPGGAPYTRTFSQPGTYSYLCSIHGTVMTGTVVVEEPGQANQQPVADPMLGNLTGSAPLAVSVMAHASDPDGDPLTYLWDFGTGNEADRSAFEDASFVYQDPGFYTLSLLVADDRGGTFERSWQVTVGGGDEAPTVSATGAPTSGAAPLPVAFAAQAYDEQGGPLAYAWDFGDAGDLDVATTPQASWTYAAPGTYTATLTVTDAQGHAGVDTVDVVVGDGASGAMPEVTATASRPSGRGVRFSTEVATSGVVRAYSAGLATYPDLAGTAELVRRRGETYARIDVSGVEAGAAHQVHVHERSCADERGGVHYRFDEAEPFAEDNEIWLYFTSDAAGRSGTVETTQPQRAGAKAVAIVVHDPVNPANRIGCVDLAPTTADLTYAWDFGDGTTGVGADPDHVYDADGTYTATVTVARPGAVATAGAHAAHGAHGAVTADTDSVTSSVTSSVRVVVDTVAPRARLTGGPAGTVRSRRATFGVAATEAGSSFACRLDGAAWSRCGASVTVGGLRDGRHVLQVRATDRAGNTGAVTTRAWTVDATGPVVRAVSPTRPVRDRTPTVRAVVSDRLSAVRRHDVVLRVDGRRVAPVRLDARTGRVSWTPRRALRPGRHVVRLVVVDAVGNRSVRTWAFRVRNT